MSPLLRRAPQHRLDAARAVLDKRARKRGLTPRERFARILVDKEIAARSGTP